VSTLAMRFADIAARWTPEHACIELDETDFRDWSAAWSTPNELITVAVVGDTFTLAKRWTKLKLQYASLDQIRAVLDVFLPVVVRVHEMVRGWGGVPGGCGAECACGVTFDGFDTLTEATAMLADHIAAETAPAQTAPDVPTPAQDTAVRTTERATLPTCTPGCVLVFTHDGFCEPAEQAAAAPGGDVLPDGPHQVAAITQLLSQEWSASCRCTWCAVDPDYDTAVSELDGHITAAIATAPLAPIGGQP
jgi:hypothetical protein